LTSPFSQETPLPYRVPRIVALPIEDAEVFTHAHLICLKDREDTRVIAAFLNEAHALADIYKRSTKRRDAQVTSTHL
jgi:hypothetical protein